jgi:hypothetical protein
MDHMGVEASEEDGRNSEEESGYLRREREAMTIGGCFHMRT